MAQSLACLSGVNYPASHPQKSFEGVECQDVSLCSALAPRHSNRCSPDRNQIYKLMGRIQLLAALIYRHLAINHDLHRLAQVREAKCHPHHLCRCSELHNVRPCLPTNSRACRVCNFCLLFAVSQPRGFRGALIVISQGRALPLNRADDLFLPEVRT